MLETAGHIDSQMVNIHVVDRQDTLEQIASGEPVMLDRVAIEHYDSRPGPRDFASHEDSIEHACSLVGMEPQQ